MPTYYNEIDAKKAAWIRELMKEGLVSDGVVDTRSIELVQPADLVGFERCHFFAGIAVWDYALNLSGWTGPVWTGSCPCPSFSAAGKGQGFEDPRHLWPHWCRLIRECKPSAIFGEQVGAAIGHGWLDLVQNDMENEAYAVGAVVFPACSVGAPHIRQRLYWVAESGCSERGRREQVPVRERGTHDEDTHFNRRRGFGILAHSEGIGRGWRPDHEDRGRRELAPSDRCTAGNMGNATSGGRGISGDAAFSRSSGHLDGAEQPGPVNGFWRDAEWIPCKDGKYRPAKSGIFPLAHGYPQRVGLLRGAGDAIVAQQAAAFILAYLQARGESVMEAASREVA